MEIPYEFTDIRMTGNQVVKLAKHQPALRRPLSLAALCNEKLA
jgi:hypothetical protein